MANQISWSDNKSTNVYEVYSEIEHQSMSTGAFLQLNQSKTCSEPTYSNLSSPSTAIVCGYDLVSTYHSNGSLPITMGSAEKTTITPINAVNNGENSTVSGSHHRRGSPQLWQFLVALLDDSIPRYIFFICENKLRVNISPA